MARYLPQMFCLNSESTLVKIVAFLVALTWTQLCFSNESYIDKIPDFTQTDVLGKSSGNGQQYCAPVAVSNSIAWLNGSKGLQLELINKLASKRYMNTSLKNGTGTTGVLRGVDKISKELFGGYKELSYEGWRLHPETYSTGIKVPDIKKIESYIREGSAAWLNVGWYTYDSRSDEYKRIGGHWVTLVGTRGDQLIIHDPSPRAGKRFSNEYVEYEIINSGILTGRKKGLPTSAEGHLVLGKGMHVKSSADLGIVDGVVYFKL